MKEHEITVFYSWQSDLPPVSNHYFIRDALRDAIKKVGRDDIELKIRLDHDTLGASGSPDIKEIIFRKIDQCTIFICDVSIVNWKDTNSRRSPNPNVLIELGYAIAKLGWDKIILIFNEHYGKIEDLPFDIRSHRVSKYHLDASNPSQLKRDTKKSLESICYLALRNILDSGLEGSKEQVGLGEFSAEEVRRRRDINMINKFLYSIYIPDIDNFFESAQGDMINESIFTIYSSLESVILATDFYLYDKELNEIIIAFFTELKNSLSFGHTFERGGGKYVFTQRYMNNLEQWKIDHSNFHISVNSAKENFKNLIRLINEKYLEIDISAITEQMRQDLMSNENM